MIPLLTKQCSLTKEQEIQGKYARAYHYHGGYNITDRESYQEMVIGTAKISLLATSPKLYETIAEVAKSQEYKPHKTSVKASKLPLLVSMVKTGQHKETETWTANDGKEYSCDNIVIDYKPEFDNCLIPKEWLEAHYKDIIPEPTIEISIDGKSLSLNGNYKKGLIQTFMGEFTEKVRVGKHSIITNKANLA